MKNVLAGTFLFFFSLQAVAEVTSAQLFNTINKRLSYMEDVALFKAQNHLPIEDLEREKIVIDKSKLAAGEKGLDPDLIEGFFKAQISVAKAIQFRYRADFLSKPSAQRAKDLQKEIRPILLSLGDQIVQQIMMYLKIYGVFRPSQFAEFSTAISTKYVTIEDKQLLFRALLQVEQLPTK